MIRSRNTAGNKTRRAVNHVIAARRPGLGILLAAAVVLPGAGKAEKLVFASVGGSYHAAMRQAWLDPAAVALGGVEVQEDSYSEAIFSLRAQVSTRQVTWDLVDLGGFDCVRAAESGLLEPLDYDVIDATGIPQDLRQPNWLGVHYRSFVFGWSRDAFGDDGPKNWQDFWDVERFPGKRGVWRYPVGTLETALMGDGVPGDELYPLDIDRAIRKLEEMRPHIAWWDTGGQAERMLSQGEVTVLAAWNGRIERAVRDGVNADLSFADGLMSFSCFAIPKGAPNKDVAMRMLAQIARPEMQARLPEIIPYSGSNADSLDARTMSPELASSLPNTPENLRLQHRLSQEWWAENFSRANDAFEAMLLR